MRTEQDPRVIVALDYPSAGEALAMARKIRGAPCTLKVGFELFTAAGPSIVEELSALGFPVFLDLKLHDIPHTVGKATERAKALGARYLTVHLLGGRTMVEAAIATAGPALKILGVSVLTSHSVDSWRGVLQSTGATGEPTVHDSVMGLIRQVPSLAGHGIVCSAHEVLGVKRDFPKVFTVTPGVRMPGESARDQARIVTPQEAYGQGADAVVMGQSIRAALDPKALIERIHDSAKPSLKSD